ncbi:MAG: MBL fold metallo-hydrolase [Burkholderiaceae bacterium]
MNWRAWAVATALVAASALCLAPARAAADFKVTLLGTGSPNPNIERFSMSTLVEAGEFKLLFDAGRGASIRLWQIGVPLGRLDAVFLTHFHSDHTIGLPDLWLTGWIDTPYGRRKSPLTVIGPVGTRALTSGLELAYADDVKTRIADENLPAAAARFDAREFSGNGNVVFQRDGLEVIAFEVDHGDAIKPAYGYRINYKDRSVLISGDTRRSDNLLKFARGVDLLIHEVATANDEAVAANPGFRAILAHHVTAAEAGAIFAIAKPKLAVYSHLVFLSDTRFPRPTVPALIEQTRKTYQGPLQVGQDLMSFVIDDDVKVSTP